MKKIPPAALAFAIFTSCAAAEPIKMTDGELELIHGGENNHLSFEITSIYPDGYAVIIQNGTEYRIAPGSTIFLSDGTMVRIAQNSNGLTLLVTNGGINISEIISLNGGSANGHLLIKNYQ